MNADQIVSEIVKAATAAEAKQVIDAVRSRKLIEEVADLLYVDSYGHSLAWTRTAIVREARS